MSKVGIYWIRIKSLPSNILQTSTCANSVQYERNISTTTFLANPRCFLDCVTYAFSLPTFYDETNNPQMFLKLKLQCKVCFDIKLLGNST